MSKITTKQYQIMTDQMDIWKFMVETYDRTWANGVPAPFWEYAITSSWMDTSYLFLNRIWYDEDRVIAFVFNESPVTDVYFSLRPGYEQLADEMVAYANTAMLDFDGKRQFVLFSGQTAIMEAAMKLGYTQVGSYKDQQFDFHKELNDQLPKGFSFVKAEDFDMEKLAVCCWKGFDHEADKGSFENWNAPDPGTPWNPVKAMKGIMQATLAPAPHSTQQYDLIIANEKGDYVCYSGMWWVPEDQLAYMEPLCTAPEYRKKGLAAAALSEHYRRMKKLGATHMTGGSDSFYTSLGYEEKVEWTFWKKA